METFAAKQTLERPQLSTLLIAVARAKQIRSDTALSLQTGGAHPSREPLTQTKSALRHL